MASSSSTKMAPTPKRLDPSAVCFRPITPGCGGHHPTHAPAYQVYLPPDFYNKEHSRHNFRPPRPVFFPSPIPDFYPPPTQVYYYWFADNVCLYNPECQPAAPANQVSLDQNVFDRPSKRVPKYATKVRPRFSPTRKAWVPRDAVQKNTTSCGLTQLAAEDAAARILGKTSLMIRNIPNQMEREELELVLDKNCRDENSKDRSQPDFCESAYDFLYLPMDFGFKLNVGFAFVNFTSADAALRFYTKYNNSVWSSGDKTKICEICPANIQGRNALRSRFERSVFECDNSEYLPAVYSPPRDGISNTKATTVGRCTGKPPPHDGVMIMTRRRERNSRLVGQRK